VVGDFSTVEDFWSYFNNMRQPSGLEYNANYHIFKEGVKPMWEDPQNAKGGKWILQLKGGQKEKLNEYWETIVLSIIGEMLEPTENGNEICGAVMSKRKTGDRIAVWNRTNRDQAVIMAIGHAIRDSLATGPAAKNIKLSYQVHEDSLKSGASYTNPARYQLSSE
jgi:translation initiation factor 4E